MNVRIKATVTFEYRLEDKEITRFKERVLQHIRDNICEPHSVTLDDIPDKLVEDYLKDALPDIIQEMYLGYGDADGVEINDYFDTISFDYTGEDAYTLVQEMADKIISDMEEN